MSDLPPVHLLPLGKQAARNDDNDLRLARYTAKLLTPPPSVKLSTGISFPCWWNNALGDCAIEDPGHQVEVVTAVGYHAPVVPSAADILKAYEDVGGYRPADPNNPTTNGTDNGCVMGNVMDYCRKTGIGGHRMDGYARVDTKNMLELRQAIAFFGGLHLGLALPLSAQAQVGKTWKPSTSKTNGQPGSWGGHAVLVVDYDRDAYYCETWGMRQRMTPGFIAAYADEAFVSIWPEWFGSSGRSPQGIGADELRADLGQFS